VSISPEDPLQFPDRPPQTGRLRSPRWRLGVSAVLQLVGLGGLAFGVWTYAPGAGYAVFGLGLLLLGATMEVR
jgi:hypothetical protein